MPTTTTYAELARTMPTRELLRQSKTHRITCHCDRCTALYAELAKRQEVAASVIRSHSS